MKKTLILGILALLLIPFVHAEDTVLTYQTGAEVRLLQLERAITVNELTSERVIERIQRDNPEEDVEELEEYLEELRIIKERASEIRENIEEYSREELVEEFVILRQSTNEVSREFRQAATELLEENAVSELRAERDEIRRANELNERIRETIREHNAERARNLGVEDIEERIRTGELTSERAREEIRERTTPEAREEARRERLEEAERLRERARLAEERARETREEYRTIAEERTREARERAAAEIQRVTESISDVDMAWYNRAVTLNSERLCDNVEQETVQERCRLYFSQEEQSEDREPATAEEVTPEDRTTEEDTRARY